MNVWLEDDTKGRQQVEVSADLLTASTHKEITTVPVAIKEESLTPTR